jgi:hypothetical protein
MRMNPFDIRTVVLAKHAQHVVLIHFPIALCITAVAFDHLAQWTKDRTLAAAGGILVSLPPANRSSHGTTRGIDGAPRCVSQWRQRTRLDAPATR